MSAEEVELETIGERLGYQFRNPDFLKAALVHRSYVAENEGASSNERLEFLGDAILGCVIALEIFERYSDSPEGDLAKIRSSVVNTDALAELARKIELGPALRLGKGEGSSGGSDKPKLLADGLEAVLAAVFLDGGWEAAKATIVRLFEDMLAERAENPGAEDHKTRFQEMLAKLGLEPPEYESTSEGPAHDRTFTASVLVSGEVMGTGTGAGRKRAEQRAAADALSSLDQRPTP